MTVRELIEMLSECDPDAVVVYTEIYVPSWSCGETTESERHPIDRDDFLDYGKEVSICQVDNR